jgi:hypothetical protein
MNFMYGSLCEAWIGGIIIRREQEQQEVSRSLELEAYRFKISVRRK